MTRDQWIAVISIMLTVIAGGGYLTKQITSAEVNSSTARQLVKQAKTEVERDYDEVTRRLERQDDRILTGLSSLPTLTGDIRTLQTSVSRLDVEVQALRRTSVPSNLNSGAPKADEVVNGSVLDARLGEVERQIEGLAGSLGEMEQKLSALSDILAELENVSSGFVRYNDDIRIQHITPNDEGVKHYLWAYPTNSDRSMEVLAEHSDGRGDGDVASWDWKIVGPYR